MPWPRWGSSGRNTLVADGARGHAVPRLGSSESDACEHFEADLEFSRCRFEEGTSIEDDVERAKVLKAIVEDCRALMLDVRDEEGLVTPFGSN